MSASALAGCAGTTGTGVQTQFDPTTYIAGIGPNSQWYLFVLNTAGTAYRASVLKLGSTSTPAHDPATTKMYFDVHSWFVHAPQTDFTDAPSGFVTVGGVPMTISSNHEIDSHATGVLRGCTPLSWNEIAP